MGNFVKLTTLGEDGSYTRTWIEQASIKQLSQNGVTQAGDNAGTAVLVDGTIIDLCAFNETLDTLK
jgi:hypothetical protein